MYFHYLKLVYKRYYDVEIIKIAHRQTSVETKNITRMDKNITNGQFLLADVYPSAFLLHCPRLVVRV